MPTGTRCSRDRRISDLKGPETAPDFFLKRFRLNFYQQNKNSYYCTLATACMRKLYWSPGSLTLMVTVNFPLFAYVWLPRTLNSFGLPVSTRVTVPFDDVPSPQWIVALKKPPLIVSKSAKLATEPENNAPCVG